LDSIRNSKSRRKATPAWMKIYVTFFTLLVLLLTAFYSMEFLVGNDNAKFDLLGVSLPMGSWQVLLVLYLWLTSSVMLLLGVRYAVELCLVSAATVIGLLAYAYYYLDNLHIVVVVLLTFFLFGLFKAKKDC